MPQEHYVLRCFSCETFQAHIVKKAKKWECKMCGAKQSVKRNYGKGSGKDCRNQVMKLNELRLANDYNSVEAENEVLTDDSTLIELKELQEENKPLTSKWEKYLDEPTKNVESEEEDCLTDIYSKSEEKKKRKAKTISEDYFKKSKKICRGSDINNMPSSFINELFSTPSKNKQTESCRNNEKVTDNCFVQTKNILTANEHVLISQLFSSQSENEKKRSSKTDEKTREKNCYIQTENILKSNKYAKYLDDDDDVDVNKKIENGKEKVAHKLLNLFDPDPNDLDNILSLE